MGSRDSITVGSYHLVSEQGFQSSLILSFISCIFNSRASLFQGYQKNKKWWPSNFFTILRAAEFHCSRVCVGRNLLF
jgi:hypothetical protein